MTLQGLKFINDRLKDAGLNYHFDRYNYGNGSPVYPYHVGTYKEHDAESEDGGQKTTFTIHSWARGVRLDLENDKAKIREIFPLYGLRHVFSDGSGIVVSYGRSQPIPTGDTELKRMETTLNVKEWSV